MSTIINSTIYIDMWKPNSSQTIALQREALGRELRFYISSDSIPVDLTGVTVLIYAKKPDNTSIYATCTKITEVDGYCSIELDSQFMAVKGLVQCWLKLINSTGSAISPVFNINVLETPDISSVVESVNTFTALDDSLTQIAGFDTRLTSLAGTGRTTETVKGNSDAIIDVKGSGRTTEKLTHVGLLASLLTTAKTSLVAAINELDQRFYTKEAILTNCAPNVNTTMTNGYEYGFEFGKCELVGLVIRNVTLGYTCTVFGRTEAGGIFLGAKNLEPSAQDIYIRYTMMRTD